MNKWIMLRSRTWWIGMFQIALGAALAVTSNVDALNTLHGVLADMTGGGGPYAFIMAGMALIGLRTAVA
jgi:hypothetical protein